MQLVHDFMIGDGLLLEVEVIGIKELVSPKTASGALAQMDPEAQGQAWGKSFEAWRFRQIPGTIFANARVVDVWIADFRILGHVGFSKSRELAQESFSV